MTIDQQVDAWIHEHCVCKTCGHGVRADLFGNIFCEQPGMAGGWNPESAGCEEHYFRDPALHAQCEGLMDEWYEAHRHEFELA